MSWLLIAVIVFLAIMAFVGWRNGFSRSLLSLLAIALSIVLSWMITPKLEAVVQEKTDWETGIAQSLDERFLSEVETEEDLTEYFNKMPLPATIRDNILAIAANEPTVPEKRAAITTQFASWIMTLIIDLVLFLVLSIILSLIGSLINKAIKRSAIRVVDGILGAILSVAEGILIVDAVLLLFGFLGTTSLGVTLMNQVTSSKIMTWIYDHNLVSYLAATFLHINL